LGITIASISPVKALEERGKFEPVGFTNEAAMSRGSAQHTSSGAPARPDAEALSELDIVRVRRAVPEHGLEGGEEGTIVAIFDRPDRAYLVDFSGGSGDPSEADVPVYALSADQIVLVAKFRQAGRG
jgi:Domain of unknown function (DUF4926)